MTERTNFIQIGDHRDIPMSLGLVVMAWNACEISLRHLLRTLGSKGHSFHGNLVETLVSEMGSVGIAQAITCYSKEFPDSEAELASRIALSAQILEAARPYRNYYVHHISGVTKYGIDFSYDVIEDDIPIHEAMTEGPFGKVYAKTAKRELKFFLDFVSEKSLTEFSNYLADYHQYLNELEIAVGQYLRQISLEKRRAPPKPLRVLDALKKPSFDHPKFRRRPALAPYDPIPDDEGEE